MEELIDPIHELITLGNEKRKRDKMKFSWTIVAVLVIGYFIGAMYPQGYSKVKGFIGA